MNHLTVSLLESMVGFIDLFIWSMSIGNAFKGLVCLFLFSPVTPSCHNQHSEGGYTGYTYWCFVHK